MRIVYMLAVTMLVSSCGFLAQEDERAAPELPEPPRISRSITYPAERSDIMEAVEGVARATPTQMRSLYFLVGGRIQSIMVEPEQNVVSGEMLAKLEIAGLEHELSLALLDRDIAVATLERHRATGSILADQKIQELVVAKHEQIVSHLERQVRSANIRAPFNGVIQRVQAKVSDLVQEYEPIIEISDPSVLELQMIVSETEFYELDRTMKAEVQPEAKGWTAARIVQLTHLNPQLDASIPREQFIAHLEIVDPTVGLALYDRMPARVILVRRQDAIVIPASGLREFNGRTYVRVLEGDIRREVDVKVGIRTDTEVEILEGLEEGELVIGK